MAHLAACSSCMCSRSVSSCITVRYQFGVSMQRYSNTAVRPAMLRHCGKSGCRRGAERQARDAGTWRQRRTRAAPRPPHLHGPILHKVQGSAERDVQHFAGEVLDLRGKWEGGHGGMSGTCAAVRKVGVVREKSGCTEVGLDVRMRRCCQRLYGRTPPTATQSGRHRTWWKSLLVLHPHRGQLLHIARQLFFGQDIWGGIRHLLQAP